MKRTKWLMLLGCTVPAVLAFGVLVARAVPKKGRVSYSGQLLRGARYADSLEGALSTAPVESVRTTEAVSATYLERHRLGLGSPFRIIDQALRDPMIEASTRRRLAFALLGRTLSGRGYQTDPRALDLVRNGESSPRGGRIGVGAQHLALIRSTVMRDRDPRVGELTVRLAYRLASASGAVAPRAAELAMSAAAQERDRLLSMRDAQNLIETAARMGGDPFAELRTWREGRRLAVEQPVLDLLPARAERAAVEGLPPVVARIESLGAAAQDARDGSLGADAWSTGSTPAEPGPRRGAGEGLARRMAGVAQARSAPPAAPVTVTVIGYGPLVRRVWTSSQERAVRERFLVMSRNEETIASEYALLRSRLPEGVPEAAAAVLTAGVALRPYAQERAWLPHDQAPTVRDLQLRFGIAVTFDRDVPAGWRAYLQRGLALALDDLLRIFPAYDPRGLHVRFGDSPLHERALALHDPVTRTIYFPVGSSAGVMAHEFAHDLDWQAARRHYGASGGYRTDRAVRQATDHLASALRQMASALRPDSGRGRSDPRPTEVFARNVDWFVSAALARDGRLNGYLSAVQDPVLTGYGSAMSPEMARDGGSATLRALDGMTPVPGEVRAWFTASYGVHRRMSVHEAVRRVLETPLSAIELRSPSLYSFSAEEATSALMRRAPAASAAWVCLLDVYVERSTDARGARSVMRYAAESRARGVVRRWRAFARRYAPWNAWPLRALDGAPWDPALAEATVRDVRDAILWRTVGGGTPEGRLGTFYAPAGVVTAEGCGSAR